MFSQRRRSSSYTRCKPHDRTNKTGADRPRKRKRERVPLLERKGGQLAVTRRTCLDQLSDTAAAARYIAPMHRAALTARFDEKFHKYVHSLSRRTACCKLFERRSLTIFIENEKKLLL